MNIKRLPDRKVTITKYQIEVDGIVFDDLQDLNELLEALDDTDGCMTAVCIHKDKLKDKLTKLGIISTNIRGSSYIADDAKYEELQTAVWKIIEGI